MNINKVLNEAEISKEIAEAKSYIISKEIIKVKEAFAKFEARLADINKIFMVCLSYNSEEYKEHAEDLRKRSGPLMWEITKIKMKLNEFLNS